jgi:L-ribulose-5-phosphate 4-epimerase
MARPKNFISQVLRLEVYPNWPWQTALLNQAPTTAKAAEYGTPEMAYEIMRLFMRSDAQTRKIVVMAGHEGGILTFGKDLEEAFAVLMRERKQALI